MQVSSSHEAPYQGVSQAPPQVRLKSQAQALENTLSVIPQGCIKRPPFTWLGKLEDHPGQHDGVFEPVDRATTDAILTITDEPASVARLFSFADLAPLALTVSPEAQAYLAVATLLSPLDAFRVTSVVDYTFIVNRDVEVANSADINAARNPEGMLWVRQSAYARRYSVTITPNAGSPVTVSLLTSSGATTNSAQWVDTDVIAASLLSGTYTATDGGSISGNLDALTGAGFTITRVGSVIHFSCATDFTMEVADGQGGSALLAIKDKVQRFSDLPLKAPVGFTVRITQQSGENRDDFFVQYQEAAGPGSGVWAECLAPGAELGLDPETMPIGLFNDGGWKLEALDWAQRATGDETLVPDPDFVGQNLQDLTYWRGRLGLLAGEGVTLSSAKNPFQMYPESLSALLDSDPIARVNPSAGVSTFRYGVPHKKALVAFGDTNQGGGIQAEVASEGVLIPGKTDIDSLTAFPFNRRLRPQIVGNKVYFVAPRGLRASIVYEMSVDQITATTDADDLSAAVPTYLPGSIDRVASCPVNYTIAYAESGSRDIYVHLFRHAEKERIQNCWQRWSLPQGWAVGGMFFKNTKLYLLAVNGAEAHVLTCDLSPGLVDDDEGSVMLAHLDFRVRSEDCTVTYDAELDETAIVLPFDAGEAEESVRVVVRAGYEPLPEGYAAPSVAVAGDEVTVEGNWEGVPLWLGLKYEARFEPSTFYAEGADGKVRRDGRLGLRRMKVEVSQTGFLRVEVTNRGRPVRTTTFEGLVTDDPSILLGQPALYTGALDVPLMGQNEQVQIALVNDSHFPSAILGYEWRGEFNPRSQRVG